MVSIIPHSFAQATKQYLQKIQRKNFYQQLSTKYNSPTIQEIWKSDVNQVFDEYVDGNTNAHLVAIEKALPREQEMQLLNLKFDKSQDELIAFIALTMDMSADEIYEEKETIVNGKPKKVKKITIEPNFLEELKQQYQELAIQMGEMKNNNMLYLANASAQLIFLKKQLKPQLIQELEKFKIKGVTVQNYQTYLK